MTIRPPRRVTRRRRNWWSDSAVWSRAARMRRPRLGATAASRPARTAMVVARSARDCPRQLASRGWRSVESGPTAAASRVTVPVWVSPARLRSAKRPPSTAVFPWSGVISKTSWAPRGGSGRSAPAAARVSVAVSWASPSRWWTSRRCHWAVSGGAGRPSTWIWSLNPMPVSSAARGAAGRESGARGRPGGRGPGRRGRC